VTIRLSKNFVYDVLAHFSVHDVVALNNYSLRRGVIMAGRDMIVMSIREVKRLKAVQSAIERHITQKAAASMIGLSERQVRRLVKSVREQWDTGIIHALRERPSNRKIPEEVREGVSSRYQARYPDFGPTLATEKLFERDGIRISDDTLRRWLIKGGV
jgi:hypothetical protein